MFECKKAIYDDYYIVFNGIFNSTDDVIIIDDKTYNITGITDKYTVHLLNITSQEHSTYSANEFVDMLKHNNVVYKYNRYNECIELNKLQYNN
jgi:hypothetical protein